GAEARALLVVPVDLRPDAHQCVVPAAVIPIGAAAFILCKRGGGAAAEHQRSQDQGAHGYSMKTKGGYMAHGPIFALALAFSLACNAQTDERKKLAFETIERNAAELATVGDSLYYFAELGMQEFESAKFLKET